MLCTVWYYLQEMSRRSKAQTDYWSAVAKGLAERGSGEQLLGDYGVFIYDDEKVLELNSGDGFTILWTY